MKVVRAEQVVHGNNWDETTIELVDLDPLDIAIEELRAAKAKCEKADLARVLCEERVLELLDERGEKTHVSPLDNGWQATAVYSEVVSYDDAAILDALPASEVEAVTVLKIDRKKLEAEVMAGNVDAHLVAAHAVVKPRKPFVRLSEHREQEPAE